MICKPLFINDPPKNGDRSKIPESSLQFELRSRGVASGAKLYDRSMFCSPGRDTPGPKYKSEWSVSKNEPSRPVGVTSDLWFDYWTMPKKQVHPSFRPQRAEVRRLGRTDQEIVDGILAEDDAAARALVNKYGPMINRRVWRLLGADPEHEDVVQQVLVAVLQSLPTLTDPDALADWIGKITVNTVRNELRSRRRRRLFRLFGEPPDIASDGLDPEALLIVKRGFAILDKLSTEDRILFVMRFLEGAELRAIARHTGHSLATVKRRLIKARETFLKKARRDAALWAIFKEGFEG